jgi:hypothetical protein
LHAAITFFLQALWRPDEIKPIPIAAQ